ncbi:MAG: HAMP domain-containing sensor histidine kinase, partial [Actinomycetota bacterium]|nr:HAMP domain-containing sensor histidine kinase [Actinomycetota bacterium]
AGEQEFLMSVSHDLRTPLTAISGYAEALTDGAVDDPSAAGAVIAGNAQRLSRLVGDLLDLARLNARQFRLEPRLVNAADIARNVVDDHLPRAQSYGVGLVADGVDTAAVIADPDRLAQVVGNLIDNALKFAASAVEVRVGVGAGSIGNAAGNAARNAVAEVTISVTDDGPGIPASDLPFVFERLYVTRLRPTRAENSSGLGLAIVRELVSAIGGRIEVRSQVGEASGTRMTVHLPGAQRPEPNQA